MLLTKHNFNNVGVDKDGMHYIYRTVGFTEYDESIQAVHKVTEWLSGEEIGGPRHVM